MSPKRNPYNPLTDPNMMRKPAAAPTTPTYAPSPVANTGTRVSFTPVPHNKKQLEENYVDLAESVIRDIQKAAEADRRMKVITSTKLRNLFELFSETYNQCLRLDGDELTEAQVSALRNARVRIVYECGRDKAVDDFVKKSYMLEFLFSIEKSKAAMIRYYHYIEALVAYGRFTGLTKDEK